MNQPQHKSRQYIIQVLFSLATLLLIWRALELQVLDDSFGIRAEATAMSKYTLYPSRGLIYDRNQELLINNKPVYDLMITYKQLSPQMDTAKFCNLLGISKLSFEDRLKKIFKEKWFRKSKPFVFLSKINAETYAKFQESLYEFPGFDVQVRSVRRYPFKNAAHVLGFIREVDEAEVENLEEYTAGDYIGAKGLEKAYEADLKGTKGAEFVLKNNVGANVGKYKDGDLDASAISGKDIIASIDIGLQRYGEELMQNKIGAIVAIEPASGEILAMVSAPTYDPNDMTISRERGKAFEKLAKDSLKPLFNRAVMAEYPPGSIFKPVVSLIGLQEQALNPNRYIHCPGYYSYNDHVWGCRQHPLVSSVAKAIQYSCNTYFFITFREIVDQNDFYHPEPGLDKFVNHLYRFGLDNPLKIDFPGEKGGNVPTVDYYNSIYPKDKGGWKSPTILSIAIGQGEMQLTTLQMANITSIIANRGFYKVPHFLKEFGDGSPLPTNLTTPHYVDIDSIHFEPVIRGMELVVNSGTAWSAFIPDIPMAGKTGTVENKKGRDHSTFIAFAPAHDPKIAVAVYVENAGGGGSFAAPIASLIIEKYMNGDISPFRQFREKQMLEANLIARP